MCFVLFCFLFEKKNLHYHDLFFPAGRDAAIVAAVVLHLWGVILVFLLILLQTRFQFCFLLIHRGAAEAALFTDAAMGQTVMVLTHGRYWSRELCWEQQFHFA